MDATRAMALPTVPRERAEPKSRATPKSKATPKPKPAAKSRVTRGAKPAAAPAAEPAAGNAHTSGGGTADAGRSAGATPGKSKAGAVRAAAASAPVRTERPQKKAADAPAEKAGGPDRADADRTGAAGSGADRPAGARPGFDAEAAKERLRAVLQSVRGAAAAVTARMDSGSGDGNRSPARASVTDVVPRRTLIIVAVVVVLAVLGTVLAVTLGGDDSAKKSGKASGKQDTSSSASRAKPSTDAADTSGDKAKGQAPSSPQPPSNVTPAEDNGGKDDGGGKGGKALPDGFSELTNGKFHFRMAMPKGFHQTDTAGEGSGAIYSTSGGFPRIQIDYNAKPGTDAAASWRSLEPAVRSSSEDYHLIGIKSVKWRGYPTVADWSFTRRQNGEKVRVLDRGFKADDDHGYAIMITCKADAWSDKACQQ